MNFEELAQYKSKIKDTLEKGLLEKSEELISEYETIYPYDVELYTIKSTLYFMKGDLNSAENELLKIYDKFEFNVDINYNLAMIYLYKHIYEKAVYYFHKCLLTESDLGDMITAELEKLLYDRLISTANFKSIQQKITNMQSNYNRVFPIKDSTSTYIGKFLFEKNNQGYITGYYDYYFPERDGILSVIPENQLFLRSLFKVEILPAKRIKNISINISKNTIIPLMTLNPNQEVTVNLDNSEYNLKNLLPNRFYYYPANKDSTIAVNCEDEFILGDLIQLDYDKTKPRLILSIFIDGLSQKFIEENNLKELMPNIYKFFKKGTICNNCYVTGEWTYVSLASFFTGLYTTEHMSFNPDYDTDSICNKELFHQILHNDGYFTAKIDGDWRSTPSSGYVKGFDRYLYQPSIRGMHCDDIIMETIEHLEAFKEKNNFVWICIPDLHDVADEFETKLSTQVNNNIPSRVFNKTLQTSVRKEYDTKKIHRYQSQLKRIDTYLGLLLNYINENYTDDEIVVNLISDHGQGYLVKSDDFLDEERMKVPMMFRGRNIPQGTCSELIQGLDLFPIILNSANITDFDKKQGNIPTYFGGTKKREYTYSESIFPKSPYRAVLNDLTHKFFFTTKENCGIDGRFKAVEYEYRLINKQNSQDETAIYKETVEKYLDIVFEHIKHHVII
jgi:arylsulfatase A-like enzyme